MRDGRRGEGRLSNEGGGRGDEGWEGDNLII